MVEKPTRELDERVSISSISDSSDSKTSVTRASTRSALAPGNAVKTTAFRATSSGSSCRGNAWNEEIPHARIITTVKISNRILVKNGRTIVLTRFV